ncbi:hypothetical protein QZH41_015415, partial [Actinostola sp. cb2023]
MAARLVSFARTSLVRVSPAFRGIHTAAGALRTSQEFDTAKERSTTLKDDPGNEAKLKLYALFKQATVGQCNAPKPGAFNFVEKVKWTAWSNLGSMTKDEAEKQYIQYVSELE